MERPRSAWRQNPSPEDLYERVCRNGKAPFPFLSQPTPCPTVLTPISTTSPLHSTKTSRPFPARTRASTLHRHLTATLPTKASASTPPARPSSAPQTIASTTTSRRNCCSASPRSRRRTLNRRSRISIWTASRLCVRSRALRALRVWVPTVR